jgi:DNA adenine methylase
VLPYRVGVPTVAGDIVPELIRLWTEIRDSPGEVAAGYTERWSKLQEVGHTAFYDVRRRFNSTRDPIDLLFLSRTCVNGLIRFNAEGDFNNSLHHTRPGISPARLRGIILDWSKWLQDVTFAATDFRETLRAVRSGDFVFLDPPYAASKGRYRKADFDVAQLFAELDRLNMIGARWMLTFDGSAGSRRYPQGLPRDLYQHTFSVATGNSPFPRLQDGKIDAVRESVFLNFKPLAEAGGAFTDATQDILRSRGTTHVQATLPRLA